MTKFDFTVDEMVKQFRLPRFEGFVGDTCELCKNTVNVVHELGWICPQCKHYNFLSPNKQELHDSPDFGPDGALIRKAKNIAKVRNED